MTPSQHYRAHDGKRGKGGGSFRFMTGLFLVIILIIFMVGVFYNAVIANDLQFIPRDPHTIAHQQEQALQDHERPIHLMARSVNKIAKKNFDRLKSHMSRDPTHDPLVVIARHGEASGIPENTMAAFRAAVSMGVDIKTDLRWTRDGHIVCIEHERLDETTTGKGLVSQHTLGEVRAVHVLPLPQPAGGDRVPTLDELLTFVAKYPGIHLYLEVKDDGMGQTLRRLLSKFDLLDRTVLCFRSATELHDLYNYMPEVTFAMLGNHASQLGASMIAGLADYNVHTFIMHKDELPKSFIEIAHAHNARVFVYPLLVQDKAWLSELHSTGRRFNQPDGFLSNHPQEILKSLGKEAMFKAHAMVAQSHKRNVAVKQLGQAHGQTVQRAESMARMKGASVLKSGGTTSGVLGGLSSSGNKNPARKNVLTSLQKLIDNARRQHERTQANYSKHIQQRHGG